MNAKTLPTIKINDFIYLNLLSFQLAIFPIVRISKLGEILVKTLYLQRHLAQN